MSFQNDEKCLSFTQDPIVMPDEFIFPELNFDDENQENSLDDAEFARKTQALI